MGKQKAQLVNIQLVGLLFCDLVRIQTLNLQSRNLVLYSVELRGQFECKDKDFFSLSKLELGHYSITALKPRSNKAVHNGSRVSYSPLLT